MPADYRTALALVRAGVARDLDALDGVVDGLTDDDARLMASVLARMAARFLVDGARGHDRQEIADYLSELLLERALNEDNNRGRG